MYKQENTLDFSTNVIPNMVNALEELKKNSNVISITLLDNNILTINKKRLTGDGFAPDRLDNRWQLTEIDKIMNSIKGTWTIDEYIGFIDSSVYHGDLFDPKDNLDQEIKDKIYAEYEAEIEKAKSNIPKLEFSVKECNGKETNSNGIYQNNVYPSPTIIILSPDRFNDRWPKYRDSTILSRDFFAEYPVIYIKFFILHAENNYEATFEPATLVITSDKRFYVLIHGAFYSLKNI